MDSNLWLDQVLTWFIMYVGGGEIMANNIIFWVNIAACAILLIASVFWIIFIVEVIVTRIVSFKRAKKHLWK